MASPVLSRRRWMLRVGDQHIVVARRHRERKAHVVMKALVWALYLPQYPNATIEIRIGDRYRPDVVAMSDTLRSGKKPLFWGEAGRVSPRKIGSLLRRHRDTHFAFAKWGAGLTPLMRVVENALRNMERSVPIDLISFPLDSAERFINADGNIAITFSDVTFIRY